MNYFLAKTDPKTYSIEDLEKEKTTTWNGVRNPQAVLALKKMKKGDRVLIYHSQGESTIRGLAEVVGNSRPDEDDLKSWLVDFKFKKSFKEPYITLSEIKKTGRFEKLPLVRQGRLSTMELTKDFIVWLKEKGLEV
jgi:predicted RNA-binding protein with PUA-like domain